MSKLTLTLGLLIVVAISQAFVVQNATNEVAIIETGVEAVGNKTGIMQSYFNPLNYYVAPNQASWLQAISDCQRSWLPDSHLLTIESEEELEFVNIMLESYGIGLTYWTSGRFDPTSSSEYRWWMNMKPLAPFIPWGPNYPPNVGSAVYRVALAHVSQIQSNFEVWQDSLPLRYICERDIPSIPVPCYANNDLIIVLDSSGSISSDDYTQGKDFVAQLATAFTASVENRLAFLIFSTNTELVIPLQRPFNPDQLDAAIRAANHMAQNTNTHLAIDAALSVFADNDRGVPQNLVVLTDGVSGNPALTREAAARAKARNIRMFSVGIGSGINHDELYTLAGEDVDRMYTSDTFEGLVQLLSPISRNVCPD